MKPLISRYPDFYAGSLEFNDLQAALEPEVLALWERRDSLLDQLNVATATWGLKYWEQTLGIPVEESKQVEFRRTRIQSRLRGAGVTTVALIKNVAESFTNGEVDVKEYPSLFKLELKFVSQLGVPPNINDLTAALRDILPAHLAWDYVYVFRTYGQLEAYTYGQLAAYTYEQLREGALV